MNVLRNRKVRENDAVMFDIDDTLIFTNGQANLPVIRLLYDAMLLGYKIIIITARPALPITLAFTKAQLKHYKIPYTRLYLTPAQNKGNLKRMTKLNYVLSVGDQPTDLTDTMYALKIVK